MASDRVTRYIAVSDPILKDHIPVLIRVVRDENGSEWEESWRPRENCWAHSHHLLDERTGRTYDEFTDIDESQARAIQEAQRELIAQRGDQPPLTG